MSRPPRHRLAAGFVVAALVAAAVVALAVARSPRYEAEAAIEVTPVRADDATFAGFSVLRAGRGPAQTAAQLVQTRPVADAVATRIHLGSADEALDRVEAHADASGEIVRIRGRGDDAVEAAQIANAFADELIRQRSSLFQTELQRTLQALRRELAEVPPAQRNEPPALDIARRVAALRTYEQRGDPTLRVASTATAPRNATSPAILPILAFGLPLALALGALVAFVPLVRGRRENAGAPGAFNVGRLERAVDANAEALEPEQREELEAYLRYLRDHAAPDGTLPKALDGLVEDVFEPVLPD